MSDSHHVEPENPPADAVATRMFTIGIIGVLGFITVVFTFVL